MPEIEVSGTFLGPVTSKDLWWNLKEWLTADVTLQHFSLLSSIYFYISLKYVLIYIQNGLGKALNIQHTTQRPLFEKFTWTYPQCIHCWHVKLSSDWKYCMHIYVVPLSQICHSFPIHNESWQKEVMESPP